MQFKKKKKVKTREIFHRLRSPIWVPDTFPGFRELSEKTLDLFLFAIVEMEADPREIQL